jgi:hypothetical protein
MEEQATNLIAYGFVRPAAQDCPQVAADPFQVVYDL